MKRHWVFAFAALAVLPRLGHAQMDTGWGPRLRITPFVGISPSINQKGFAAVFVGANTTEHQYTLNIGSGMPAGLDVEYRFYKRFGVLAGGMWTSRGASYLDDFTEEERYPTTGNTLFIGKFGPTLHLQEGDPDMQLKRLNATIYAAGAFIHDSPKSNIAITSLSTTGLNQWGLNLGANGELPLADTRFAFQAGLEDFIIFWDKANYSRRIQAYLEAYQNSKIVAVAADPEKTHLFVGRIGLTFRF